MSERSLLPEVFKSPARGPWAFVAKYFRANSRAWNNLRGVDGVTVTSSPDGSLEIGLAASPLAALAFGPVGRSASNTLVLKFNGGPVQLANNTLWLPAAEVSVGGSLASRHLVYAEGITTGGAIQGTTVTKASWVGHDETYWRFPIAEVYVASGVARIYWPGGIHHVGVMDLKSWYAGRS